MMTQSAMDIALTEAEKAASRNEVPVGAVIIDQSGQIIAQNGNRCIELSDPTAHAEFLVLRAASAVLSRPYLDECDLYVTLEPCALCAAAIGLYRVKRLYFGAYDPKGGAIEHGARIFTQPTTHWQPEIYGGIRESDCSFLLKQFFLNRRNFAD